MVQRANGTGGFFLSIPRTRGRSDQGDGRKWRVLDPFGDGVPCIQRVRNIVVGVLFWPNV